MEVAGMPIKKMMFVWNKSRCKSQFCCSLGGMQCVIDIQTLGWLHTLLMWQKK